MVRRRVVLLLAVLAGAELAFFLLSSPQISKGQDGGMDQVVCWYLCLFPGELAFFLLSYEDFCIFQGCGPIEASSESFAT